MKFKYLVCPNCKKKHIEEEHTSGFDCKCKKTLMLDLEELDINKIKKDWLKSASIMCCKDLKLFKKLLKEDEDKHIFLNSIMIDYPDDRLLQYAEKSLSK